MRRAHGVRGAWAVESLTDAPDALLASGALLFAGDRNGNPVLVNGEPQALHVEDGRPMNREWLVRVREMNDRDLANEWRGRYLLTDSSNLPPLGDDEIHIDSLIGMTVEVDGKGAVGRVSDVYEAPQGFLIEVQTPTGRPLVPWHDDIILSVDEDARVIVVVALDGLLG